MTSPNDRTLKQEFSYALSQYAKLFSGQVDTTVVIATPSTTSETVDPTAYETSRSETYQNTLKQAISSFESTKLKSEHLSLFSANESVEDIATNDLPYLAIDYYLATLTDKTYTDSLPARKPLALKSKGLYLSFLTLCDSYGLLDKDAARLLHAILEAPIDTPIFSTAHARGFSDPGAQRMARIAKFKREKAIETQVKELRARHLAKTDDDDDDQDEDDSDDEVARELYLKQIALFVERSFDALQALDSELEILTFAAARPAVKVEERPEPPVDSSVSKKDDYSERLDAPLRNTQSILSSEGKVNRPFTIVSSREQIKKNVFKPDYVLPTMTIDEYLEEERKRGNIIEGGGPESAKNVEKDEDDEEDNDKETYRLRHWDEFVEANPRGSGNTLNRG
ncbi:TAP42-like protein [Lipomyces kononenkoae]|uniref:TAP42-like protein n=1 Tax=Lipomyces kononenkoae TaxID=34357 RepID=A0ACC3T1M1_LIPKO